MNKLSPQKAAGFLVSLTGLYFLVRFVPSLLFVLNKPMTDKTAEYIIVVMFTLFVISGIYLIFTQKTISPAKSKFLFVNVIIIIILSFIPPTREAVLPTSVGLAYITLFVYFISFPIVILTSKRSV